ncbi:MAG TPA: hypothetical protein DD381_14570 [Lentisphaeria bacterium]|nr:MAG: hypothetical protein A2X47_01390 [Lentisphaerae bacterium GWF2_38_69]HBM17549.1 hypothetical protein [Lentisphaeria bacterium]
MPRIQKFSLMLLFSLSTTAIVADDTNSYDAKQTEYSSASLQQNDKLQTSLQETDLEIKMRQKIEKEIQEQNEIKEQSVLSENEEHSILHVALMYIPNRFIDLSEIISMGAGVGPEASLELTFTKWGQFGASYGDRYFIEKGYTRQYGGGYSTGYNAAFACWCNEEKVVDYCFGTVNPYVNLNLKNSSVPCPCSEPYKSGNVDFWRIGVKAGWLFDFEFAFHPVAMANFITGFAFVRLTNTQDL